jgi:hypothetical protein
MNVERKIASGLKLSSLKGARCCGGFMNIITYAKQVCFVLDQLGLPRAFVRILLCIPAHPLPI